MMRDKKKPPIIYLSQWLLLGGGLEAIRQAPLVALAGTTARSVATNTIAGGGTNVLLRNEKRKKNEKREEKAIVPRRISICAGSDLFIRGMVSRNGPRGLFVHHFA